MPKVSWQGMARWSGELHVSSMMWLVAGETQRMAEKEVKGLSRNETPERSQSPQKESGLDLEDSGESVKHFKQGLTRSDLSFRNTDLEGNQLKEGVSRSRGGGSREEGQY